MKKGKKALIVVMTICLVFAVFFAIANIIPVKKTCENNPWRKVDHPYISAHRGGSELNPENTRMAFDYAIIDTHYIDVVEFDAWFTKDGHMVICHDAYVNKMACQGYDPEDKEKDAIYIKDHTLAELRLYNLGRNFVDREGNKPYENLSISEAEKMGLTIMTVPEFFERYQNVRDDVRIAFEVKEEELERGSRMVDEIYQLIDNKFPYWKDKVLVISFGDDVMKYHMEKYPDRWCGPLGYLIAMEVASNKFGMNGLVQVDFPNIQTQMYNTAGSLKFDCGTKNFNYWCHKRNQATTYWVINDEEGMKKLVRNNADMITTDAPDKLYKVIYGKEYLQE
ncbi:MAG: hypothetical protein K5839_00880 [Treponemataceae bacterium]|nr:hypothetical protein [Treponemataceae bacterium]